MTTIANKINAVINDPLAMGLLDQYSRAVQATIDLEVALGTMNCYNLCKETIAKTEERRDKYADLWKTYSNTLIEVYGLPADILTDLSAWRNDELDIYEMYPLEQEGTADQTEPTPAPQTQQPTTTPLTNTLETMHQTGQNLLKELEDMHQTGQNLIKGLEQWHSGEPNTTTKAKSTKGAKGSKNKTEANEQEAA